jgi:hypothetical protein
MVSQPVERLRHQAHIEFTHLHRHRLLLFQAVHLLAMLSTLLLLAVGAVGLATLAGGVEPVGIAPEQAAQ